MPFNIILLFFFTTILSSDNSILHQSSASTGSDSSCVSISLKWKAVFASSDTSGISSFDVVTESIVCLLAHMTLILSCMVCLALSFGRKWPVAPESAVVLMYSTSSMIAASALLYLLVREE